MIISALLQRWIQQEEQTKRSLEIGTIFHSFESTSNLFQTHFAADPDIFSHSYLSNRSDSYSTWHSKFQLSSAISTQKPMNRFLPMFQSHMVMCIQQQCLQLLTIQETWAHNNCILQAFITYSETVRKCHIIDKLSLLKKYDNKNLYFPIHIQGYHSSISSESQETIPYCSLKCDRRFTKSCPHVWTYLCE